MKKLLIACLAAGLIVVPALASAGGQVQMPDPKQMSGRPLPNSELPLGTVSVRVMIGGFDKNVPNQPVEFLIDGESRTVNTGEDGRALSNGIRTGAQVQVVTTVNGERLESLAFTMPNNAMQVALVATDPEDVERAEQDKALAEAEAVKGIVVLGPESTIEIQLDEAGLQVFYSMSILNSARTPVDIGGPLIFELPQGARATTILDGSSAQASANGARFLVTGPFAPGVTRLVGAFELPYRSATVQMEQVWPATLQQLSLFVQQIGNVDIASTQIATRNLLNSESRTFIGASGPAIPAGQALTLEISGLPHHPVWPRWIALALAAGFILLGFWSAFNAKTSRIPSTASVTQRS